jgi:hypothetical protein
VAAVIKAIGALVHFDFVALSEEPGEYHDFPILYPAFWSKRNTLQVIILSAGAHFSGFISKKRIGSFSDFPHLRQLRIPGIVLMGPPDDDDPLDDVNEYIWKAAMRSIPLIELLPASLESLVLAAEFTDLSDDTKFLWDFLEGIDRLPELRTFDVAGSGEGEFDMLSQALTHCGVKFGSNWTAEEGW